MDFLFYIPFNSNCLIILASFASLFSGRALAMDNRMYDHEWGKYDPVNFKKNILSWYFYFYRSFIGWPNIEGKFFLKIGSLKLYRLNFTLFLFSSITRIGVWIKFLRNRWGRYNLI